ncbi:metal-sensitive transcriptional regulator [Kovacikia minuta CCNUW1]|uniref:metal-sensing transcriptional repressor n=1 Tax=Kovacikia minuta TaxID=2931930 RepID=UPI001CCF990D|nr:metal-sensitive transcriptional regulator [Kovacikia minuta]UBF24217.1 metal-sensitive transcriptional regulator [Kovacikia minuta CCNUW1]
MATSELPSRIKADLLTSPTILNEEEGHSHNHSSSAHAHVHSEESLRQLVNRLSRIEGHIRGIKTMIQASEPCPDVLIQIAAVRGALDRVARLIFDEHLSQCIARAAEEGNIEAEIKELKLALDRFLPLPDRKSAAKQ